MSGAVAISEPKLLGVTPAGSASSLILGDLAQLDRLIIPLCRNGSEHSLPLWRIPVPSPFFNDQERLRLEMKNFVDKAPTFANGPQFRHSCGRQVKFLDAAFSSVRNFVNLETASAGLQLTAKRIPNNRRQAILATTILRY